MRLFSIFLLLGTLLIQWLPQLPSWRLSSVCLVLILVVSLFRFFLLKESKSRSNSFDKLLILISAFLLGLSLASYHASRLLDNRLATSVEGKELIITGKIIGIPTVRDDGVRFLLDVSRAEFVEGFQSSEGSSLAKGSSLTKGFQSAEGSSFAEGSLSTDGSNKSINLKGIVRLGWYQQVEELRSGEIWHLKVKLKQPSGFMNPGGFDYEKWLFTQRIIATGYVRKPKEGEQTANVKMLETITPEVLWSVDHLRQKIHQTIQQRVENKSSAAVLSALLVAVRDKLDDKQWQLLQATGTSHLVAISGLHIAVVAGFAFFPMMLLWRLFPRLNERIPLRVAGAVVGTLFAICYAMLAGFTLPTQRALLMVMIGLWGLVSRRNYDSFSILALAVILVLLWDPLAAMSVSFWLSFLAVFLILTFIKRQIEKPRWMVVKLQLFISFAMLPLTLLFFGNASLTSPIANVFAIPWVSLLIVPISLLALVLMPVSSFLSTQLLALASVAIEILFKGLELLSGSALSSLSFAEIPSILLIVAFLGVLMLILPKGFPGRWMGMLLMMPAVIYQVPKLQQGEFTYTLLDVGQGYASVLQTKNHNLVYDTGTRISESFDLGKLVVGPYLQSKGIKKIDTLMVSHEDIDHRGGAVYLQKNFEINEYKSSYKERQRSKTTNDISPKIDWKSCLTDQQWQWDGVNFEVLSPQVDFQGNDNNRSCVLKVWNKHHSLLLTGDIQKQTEKALLKLSPTKLKADVLAVPHHGSKTSSTQEFIQQVSPKIGLISAGYRSRFGHPKPEVVKRYRNLNVELLDTVKFGATTLHFPSDNNDIQREYFRIENSGFWSR